MFPLAEWLANNWWFLQSEVERPDACETREFDRRHNLRWAREGFVLPSLRFVTVGQDISCQWQSLDIPDAGIKFLGSGQDTVSGRAFEDAVGDFVNAVVARLDDMGLTNTSLHEQWRAVQDADVDEREFCGAAARLGKDPYAMNDDLTEEILDASRKIRPELLNDFLSVATSDRLSGQAAELAAASQLIADDADNIDALKDLRSRAPTLISRASPWETGYQFAANLRANLSGGPWKSHSLDELAGHLGIDRLEHCLIPDAARCRFLDALAGSNQRHNPKFLIEKKRADSRQFAFCRALCEHLTSPVDQFAAVSGLRTDRQRINRTFAAEFLVPHEMLRRDLSGGMIGEDEINDLALDYGVSAFVIRHQILNHQLARVAL